MPTSPRSRRSCSRCRSSQQLGTQALSIANQAPQSAAQPVQVIVKPSDRARSRLSMPPGVSIDASCDGKRTMHVERSCWNLRQGEVMIVNGAPIRFRTKIADRADRQGALPVRQADHGSRTRPTVPARRIYFALQSAYIGTPEERRGRAGLGACADRPRSRSRPPPRHSPATSSTARIAAAAWRTTATRR